jgi:aldose 1-epimerase
VSGVRPATGRQFELRRGDAIARIGQVAAVLREFSVGGVHFTEIWDDAWVPPMGCGIVLVPWPNRIRDGKWTYQDEVQKLDITDLSLGHATHGLLRNTAYQVADERSDSLTLAASVYPQHGYPFILDTSVTYALGDDGLSVTHKLTNAGAEAAPFGVGAHPYLRVGEHPVPELTVTVSGSKYVVVDDRLIPVSVEPVEGTDKDFRGGRRVADLDVDVALTGLDVTDGKVVHRLEAPDGTGVELWADEVFAFVQVFTPPKFPGPGKPNQRKAIAMEPTTCAANVFNSGDGLHWLEPGETWSATWGLRPTGF